MKTISIKTQKILTFIPLVNTIVLFIWIHNYRVSINKAKIFAKSLLVMYISTIPLAILYGVLLNLFLDQEAISLVINCFAIYLIPFSLSSSLVWFQKKTAGQTGQGDGSVVS